MVGSATGWLPTRGGNSGEREAFSSEISAYYRVVFSHWFCLAVFFLTGISSKFKIKLEYQNSGEREVFSSDISTTSFAIDTLIQLEGMASCNY